MKPRPSFTVIVICLAELYLDVENILELLKGEHPVVSTIVRCQCNLLRCDEKGTVINLAIFKLDLKLELQY